MGAGMSHDGHAQLWHHAMQARMQVPVLRDDQEDPLYFSMEKKWFHGTRPGTIPVVLNEYIANIKTYW